jgi:ABC-type nitrate/sulfonate/bicarbonate transport system permease component
LHGGPPGGVQAALPAEPPDEASPRAGASRTRRRGRRVTRVALILGSIVALYLLWLWGATKFEEYILPEPSSVWDSFRGMVDRGIWTETILATLGHMFTAFALILAIGLPLGIIIGRLWVVEDVTRVPLIFLQCVPTVVLIALALIFIGTTATGVIAVTVASGLTYFTLNVIQGTKAIDHDLIEMGRAYGANERRLMRTVILPSVIPYFLAGARVTLGVVWQVTLFGEYLMGTPGVGFEISSAIKLLDTAAVFAWGLSIVALTIAFEYGLFRPVEWLLTRHSRRAEA